MSAPVDVIVGRALCAPGSEPARGPTEIRIVDGRIAALTPIGPERLSHETARWLALPAPANAHDHGRGLRTVAFGAADDTLESWLPALAREPRSDPYLSAAVAFARMAEGGVCATNHCHGPQDRNRLYEEAEAVSRAARDVGIRVAFAVPFMNRNRGAYGDIDNLLRLLEPEDRSALVAGLTEPAAVETWLATVERIAGLEHARFHVQYGPVGIQWVSNGALNALARASAATGRRVHVHLLETRRQREWADAAYPRGFIAFLDEIRLLSPRLTVAHGVWLRPEECAVLAERGVTVSVNQSSNLRLRSGLPPVAEFRAAGLGFGIGMDASSFDDDEDMLREIRLVWRCHRGFAAHDVLTAGDIFTAANIRGRATILGDDGGGRLTVGAPADILVLDLAQMSEDFVAGDADIADLLLTRMTKRHIRRLYVGGRPIVENSRVASVDLPALERALLCAARSSAAEAAPENGRISRLQSAVEAYYAAGAHVGKPA